MKKNGLRKWGQAAVTGLLAASMLAGCAGKDNSVSGSGSPGATSTPEAAKRYKITLFNPGWAYDIPHPSMDKDPIAQEIDRRLNVELSFILTPDQKEQKLNTLIAASDVPDLMYLESRDIAVRLYNDNTIISLDEALKATPKLTSFFAASRWEAMKVKDTTIAVPGIEGISGINGFWIRNDWLKKLNLQVPTTPEQLMEVMRAFTTQDPDGDNKANTYGFVGGLSKDGKLGMGLEALFWMYGVNPDNIQIENGKVIVDNVDPRMKEALEYVSQMVKEKVIDPDWVTTNMQSQIDEKMNKGKVGIVVADWRRMEPNGQKAMQEQGGEVPDWVFIAPPKGPRGDQYIGLEAFQSTMWTVSKKAASDPDKLKRIMSLLELMYTGDGMYPLLAYGPENVAWKKEGDAIVRLPGFSDKANAWLPHYRFVRRADDTVYFDYQNPVTSKNLELNQKYVKKNNVIPYIATDSSDTLAVDRTKFMRESLLKFITGNQSLDQWDTYVKTVQDKFDLNKLVEGITKQLKEQGKL